MNISSMLCSVTLSLTKNFLIKSISFCCSPPREATSKLRFIFLIWVTAAGASHLAVMVADETS